MHSESTVGELPLATQGMRHRWPIWMQLRGKSGGEWPASPDRKLPRASLLIPPAQDPDEGALHEEIDVSEVMQVSAHTAATHSAQQMAEAASSSASSGAGAHHTLHTSGRQGG